MQMSIFPHFDPSPPHIHISHFQISSLQQPIKSFPNRCCMHVTFNLNFDATNSIIRFYSKSSFLDDDERWAMKEGKIWLFVKYELCLCWSWAQLKSALSQISWVHISLSSFAGKINYLDAWPEMSFLQSLPSNNLDEKLKITSSISIWEIVFNLQHWSLLVN